eukprot:jgi/Botrbrau1/22126/Bobra.0206s0050.1
MARTQGATRRANIAQGQDVPANVQMMVFIQALMERQWMPETEAKQIYRKLSRGGDDVAYSQLIAEANHSMEAMKFRIKRVRYPVDNQWYVAFVNKDADATSKLHGSDYTTAQLHYLKALILHLAEAHPSLPGGMSEEGSKRLLNLQIAPASQGASQGASQSKLLSISLAEKDNLLKRYVQDGWLAAVPEKTGSYTLGPRTLMELSEFLLDLDLHDDTRGAWESIL